MNYKNELFQLRNDELGVLPINYRLMKKLRPQESKIIKLEESEFHQTKAFELYAFYKSISPCFNINLADEK